MKTLDRIILGILGVGIWALTLTFYTHPRDAFAASVNASEVDGLKSLVQSVVEDCSVDGTGFGNFDGLQVHLNYFDGNISCAENEKE